MLNSRAQNQTWRTLEPQLRNINRPWTAFLNRRERETRARPVLHKAMTKEHVQKPLGLLSHTIASVPLEAAMDLRPVLCALGRALGIGRHTVATPGTSWATSFRLDPECTRPARNS